MKRCNYCGAFIDDDSIFCTSCGKPYAQSLYSESKSSKTNSKKSYLIGGCIVGAIIIGVGLWFGLRRYFDNNVEVQLLQVQPVLWNQFVTPLNNQSTLYEQPDINHVLGQIGEGDIAPVVDETSNFYKIYIGNGKEAWVKKNQCKEIQNAPISQDLMSELLLNGQRLNCKTITFHDGDLQNLFLFFYRDFSSNGHLEVGIIDNGRLIQPMKSSIDAVALESRGYELYAGGERPRLEYGTNYQVKNEDFEQFLNVQELNKKQIADIWKAAQGDEPSKVLVYYYFPSIDGVRSFDVDLNVYGVSASNVKYQTVEGCATLSGFSYMVDDDESGLELFAEVGDKKVATGIAGGAKTLTIIHQGDYDDDGECEAIVYEWGGGNLVLPPYLVYYDKDEEVFKKVEGFEDIYEDPEIKIEDWNDQTSFVTTVGLRHDRYVYSNHSLSIAERIVPDVGTHVATIPLTQLFKVDGDDGVNRSIYIDIDDDGSTEKLVFYHDTSHASNWGNSMLLMKIEADNWRIPENEDENIGVRGKTFTFLASKNGIVPDILCDDAWLYKWNGEKYTRP